MKCHLLFQYTMVILPNVGMFVVGPGNCCIRWAMVSNVLHLFLNSYSNSTNNEIDRCFESVFSRYKKTITIYKVC